MRRVLESLRNQTLEKQRWELLVVDNASESKVADEWDLSWHPRARHIREETVGLMSARLRGISESCGQPLVFVDDDTILDVRYLSLALALSARHPHLGAIGAGTVEPEFETALPPALASRASLLGIRTVNSTLWSNNPNDWSCRPWGAGLCVAPEVAAAYATLAARLRVNDVVGRRGPRLFAGEDDLFAWAASAVGKGFGVFPELRVTHLIPPERTRHDYIVRLIRDRSFSHGVLRHMLTEAGPQRLGLFNRLRLLAHGLRNGMFSMQCGYASLRGEDEASRYIERNQLRPLDQPFPGDLGVSHLRKSGVALEMFPLTSSRGRTSA